MEDETKSPEETETEAFPSTQFLIRIYAWGAIFSLISGLTLKIDPGQVVVCLVTSWTLASISFALTLMKNNPEEDLEDY